MKKSHDNVTLFVKAGRDNATLGACPQSQRVHILAELKSLSGIIQLTVVPVNLSRPPDIFTSLDLRLRVPAFYLKDEDPLDETDEIVMKIESQFPGGLLNPPNDKEIEAELATRDFFSRFCYFVRDIAKDSSHLESELEKVNSYLENNGNLYLCGDIPCLLDCEILPKLHHVRVASAGIKGYEIPSKFQGLWRYLHEAYSNPAFVKSCPCDTEILLHWLDHIKDPSLSTIKQKLLKAKEKKLHYSFTVPVHASPIMID